MAQEKIENVIEPGGFVHTVLFWLNNSKSQSDREDFEKHLSNFIGSSNYVKSKHIGTMAPSKREVVDSSYDYALIVTFSTEDDHEKYQQEPVHIKFVEEASHLWKKVVVYDSVSIFQGV